MSKQLLITASFILGVAMVSNAVAQHDAAPVPAAAKTLDAGPATPVAVNSQENKPDAVPSDVSLLEKAYERIKQGDLDWKAIAAIALIGVVFVARRFGGKFVPFLQTDRGGALLALGVGIAGALANAILAGKPVDLTLLLRGLEVGIEGAGGYVVVRRLLLKEAQNE